MYLFQILISDCEIFLNKYGNLPLGFTSNPSENISK